MPRDAAELHRLEALVARRGGMVVTDVPVSGADTPFDGGPTHCLDAVWFPDGNRVVVSHRAVGTEFARLASSSRATVVSARGYADRPVLGMLIAGRELLSRAIPSHGHLDALAIADDVRRRSIAYYAEGIEIDLPEGQPRSKPGRRGPFPRKAPKELSREDRLMARYHSDHCPDQMLWQEVPVTDAALDGLRIVGMPGTFDWWPGRRQVDLRKIVMAHDVEVVEAKRVMNFDVIGQAIAGAILLAHDYPAHLVIRQTVLVGGDPDPALDWVCAKRGIRVVRYLNRERS